MHDCNINNDPVEGYQMAAIAEAEVAKAAFVKKVLREYAEPPMHEELTWESITANGIALVYQPTRMRMWVTQRGNKIGPEYSTIQHCAV